MTLKNPKSYTYLQIMAKHSARFQINLIKDVAGVAGARSESARAITPSKMAKTKIRNTYTSSYHKKTFHKISNYPTKMVDLGRAEDGRTHTWTDEGHFYSPSPPTSGDN